MTRAVPEWIGKTPNSPVPPRVKLRVFQKFDGICPKCTRRLQPKHWDTDHKIALINGGENRESNLQPLCDTPCHSQKTKQDIAQKSETYRKQSKSAGVKRMKRTIPGRKFNGDAIPSRIVFR